MGGRRIFCSARLTALTTVLTAVNIAKEKQPFETVETGQEV